MSDAGRRYRAIETYLCALEAPARRYLYSWSISLVVLWAIQATLLFATDATIEAEKAARASYLIGTLMTTLGLLLVALTGRHETNSCTVLRKLPADSPAAETLRLREGEKRLLEAASAARRQTSPWLHALGVILGLGVGLGLGLGYRDNLLRALLQGVGTFAFMELRIWTRPTQAIEFAERCARRGWFGA